MKSNSVTWYSKLAAAIIFIVLPFVGFYLGMKYQEAVSTSNTDTIVDSGNNNDSDSNVAWETLVSTIEITVKTKYEDGKLKYTGTVQTPSPCHVLKDETRTLLSFPEKVQIRIIITYPSPNTFCAQVVTEQEFSGEVEVSKDVVVSVFLDGKMVE